MMKKTLLIVALWLLNMGLAEAAQPLKVVASFSILGDMVEQVGGQAVTVKLLVGPNTDAHTWQPTPDDAKTLTEADLVFVNGLGFEGWLSRLIEASGTNARLVTVSEGVALRTMQDDDGGQNKTITDPHAWQNLNNGRVYMHNITRALQKALPDEAKAIQERADAYEAKIVAMDKFVRAELAAVPKPQRKIITSHDAFGYFGAAYGVTFYAPEGMTTESEPSAANVVGLIGQIKASGIKAVFIENMNSPRLIEQIARDTGSQIGGELYSDALSPADGPAPSYLDMFKNNVPKLTAAMRANNH
jgi:zinc/manganese transport system substrate-binding protein